MKWTFLKKQTTLPPLWDWSNLTRSYPSILYSLLKTVLSSLDLLHPITVAFVRLSMWHISSILDKRLFIIT